MTGEVVGKAESRRDVKYNFKNILKTIFLLYLFLLCVCGFLDGVGVRARGQIQYYCYLF